MAADPYRAIRPTITAPAMGTRIANGPSRFAAGEAKTVDILP